MQYQTTSTPDSGQSSRPGLSFGTGGVGMGGGSTETTQQTQLHLVLKNGETIDITDGSRSMSSFGVFGRVPNLAVGQQIAAFLGVPFEQLGAASLDQTVSTIRSAVTGLPEAPSVVAPAAATPVPVPQVAPVEASSSPTPQSGPEVGNDPTKLQ
jgi:hypothetical protein